MSKPLLKFQFEDIQTTIKGKKIIKHNSFSKLEEPGELGTFKNLKEKIREELIDISFKVLREEQSRGFSKRPKLKVDNEWNKSIYIANKHVEWHDPDGTTFKEALLAVVKFLIKKSPVKRGHYAKSHGLFHNKKLISRYTSGTIRYIEKATFKGGDEVVFFNSQYYGGFLEIHGIIKNNRKKRTFEGRPKAHGVYMNTLRSLKRSSKLYHLKFKKIGAIIFSSGYLGLKVPNSKHYKKKVKGTNKEIVKPNPYAGLILKLDGGKENEQ